MRMAYALVYGLAFPLSAVGADAPRVTYLDVETLGNRQLGADQDDLQGNNLSNVPRGEQELAGSRFKIGNAYIHLKGEKQPDLPAKVAGIKVGAAFRKLHILHSTAHGFGMGVEKDGTEIGSYVIRYADKTEERVPVIYGEDVRDWWAWPEQAEVTRGKVAWEGSNDAADQNMVKIQLFSKVWTNPHPEKKVDTIDFESENTKCDPFLIALTIE